MHVPDPNPPTPEPYRDPDPTREPVREPDRPDVDVRTLPPDQPTRGVPVDNPEHERDR